MRRVTLLAAALSVSWAGSAAAHDTWLAPDRYHLRASGGVTLSLSSGMEFPKLDHAIKPERVVEAKSRNSSAQADALGAGIEAAHALTFPARPARGVTTFWAVLHPRPSELKAEQVREYVEHLGIADPESTIARWQKKGSTGVAYRYMKYAKTFVRVGNSNSGNAWRLPAGMRLELVPETDPTRMTAGSTLRLLLLDHGKPRARYPVSVIHGGVTKPYVTDGNGRVTVDVAARGPYLVRATTLEPSSAAATEWDVHFTTLTFEAHSR